MVAAKLETLEVGGRAHWRGWLQEHHGSHTGIWLVFHKGAVAQGLQYRVALEEALCFGWVDSLVKRLDDQRYARKFTPRKPGSKWSTINRDLYRDLQSRGLLAPAGLARTPGAKSGDAPRPSITALPRYITAALKAHPKARAAFENLAPSCKREYIAWIDSAKREETKQRRLEEALGMLAQGKKLGMK